ncbi:hypothetical protein Pelo_12816 [Pelomyxa schiedti]|nr:hypothetical protein Pelo_12816 [Pelomyxa schiedti]
MPWSTLIELSVTATLGRVDMGTAYMPITSHLGWLDHNTPLTRLPFGGAKGPQFDGLAVNQKWSVLYCSKTGELLIWPEMDYNGSVRIEGERFKWLEITGTNQATLCQREGEQWMLVQINLEKTFSTKQLCVSSNPMCIGLKPQAGVMSVPSSSNHILVPVQIVDESTREKSYSLWSTEYNSTVPIVSQWPLRKLDDHRFVVAEPWPGNRGVLLNFHTTSNLSQPFKRLRLEQGAKYTTATNGFIAVWTQGITKLYDGATGLLIVSTDSLAALPAATPLSVWTVPSRPQQHLRAHGMESVRVALT